MTPADLRAAAVTLGLTGNGMARALGVSPRTYRRMLAGAPISPRTVLAVQALLMERQQ